MNEFLFNLVCKHYLTMQFHDLPDDSFEWRKCNIQKFAEND
jgi:hypothetical protein